jgi:hypothetical protein
MVEYGTNFLKSFLSQRNLRARRLTDQMRQKLPERAVFLCLQEIKGDLANRISLKAGSHANIFDTPRECSTAHHPGTHA